MCKPEMLATLSFLAVAALGLVDCVMPFVSTELPAGCFFVDDAPGKGAVLLILSLPVAGSAVF
jgi:hypothetical protein